MRSDESRSPSFGWDAEEEFSEPGLDDFDPREFAWHARQMTDSSGESIDPEFDAALQQVESGADPEDVFGEMDATVTSTGELDR